MTKFTSEEIKNRLSNIGEAIGSIALEYIVELEKENEQLKAQIEKMKNCSNCNGIIKGGLRTERCKLCIKDTTFGFWELAK